MHKMLNNKKLKEKAKTLEPVIRIGKNGLTESTIKEIKKQLNKKKLIKVKLLRAFISDKNKKEVAKELNLDPAKIKSINDLAPLYNVVVNTRLQKEGLKKYTTNDAKFSDN